MERRERLSRLDGRRREDGCTARKGRSRRLLGRRWRREGNARRGAGSKPRVCVFCSQLLPDGLSLSSFLGLIGCGFPLQTNTTVTRLHWIRMRDRDGTDTFRLLVSSGGAAPIVQTQFANMGSLNQVRDWSSERSISARNSPLLHKPPGTGSQVADGIHLVIVYGRLGFV